MSGTATETLPADVPALQRRDDRPRIGLVLDHPRRDMLGLVLLARELAEAGAQALIIPQYGAWIDAFLTDLDGVVFNYARSNNITAIRALSRAGKDVFVLDTEGYLSSDKHAMLLDALREQKAGPSLQGYFTWGEASARAIAAGDPGLADKLEVTGCPRFDLLAPRWRGMLSYKTSGYVLLNPNFNSVNPRQGIPDIERQSMLRGGWEEAYLDRFLTDMRAGFAGFLELCRTLPQRLPHRQFVVRPHPFELIEPYRKATEGIANIHVNAEGEVFSALSQATHLVHLNCNTSVEARLLGVPAIQAGFLNTEFLRTHLPLYSGVSLPASSLDDLVRLLEDPRYLAERDDTAGLFERWIRPSFHLCDGYAARRAANAILRRLRPRSVRLAESRSKRLPAMARIRRKGRLIACDLVGTTAIEKVRRKMDPQRNAKVFTEKDIAAAIEALSRHLGRPAPPVRRLRSRLTKAPLNAIQVG